MVGINRGPVLVGVSIMNMVLSCTVVLARVITRTLLNPQFGMDDALIIVTLFVFIGFNASVLVSVHYGFGTPVVELSPENALLARRADVVSDVLAVWTYPTGKAAIAYLLMRLFPGRTLRWALWSFVVANAICFYLNGVFALVQCSPIAYQWDSSIDGGTCWSSSFIVDWGYITGSVGAATDLAFAIVPWFYITQLHMSLRKKVTIGAALSMGLVPFICSILKIYYTSTLGNHADPTYSTVDLQLAGGSELCAINIAACVPTLLPLYLWCKGKKLGSVPRWYSSRTQRRDSHDASFRRFAGRLKRTPTEIQLSSIGNASDRTMQPRTQKAKERSRSTLA